MDICADGKTLLFTTIAGTLFLHTEGETNRVSRDTDGAFEWVRCSRSTNDILLVRSAPVASQIPTILHGTLDNLLDLRVIDTGNVPVFSENNTKVFFAKPSRQFKSHGFGGNFWTDWDIWVHSFDDNESRRITHEKFFSISDIEVATDLVWFSAVPFQGSDAVTNIYRTDNLGNVEQITKNTRTQGSSSGADPAASRDRVKIAFVSDRTKPQYYSLFVSTDLDMLENASEVATGSRYIAHPVFGGDDAIYFFRAVTWGSDGQGYLQIAKQTSPDGIQTIVTEAELGYPYANGKQ